MRALPGRRSSVRVALLPNGDFVSNFLYTQIPVIPESKAPALRAGFSYDQAVYGEDYRQGDFRQGGHVTHPVVSLFVIDVDNASEFLGTHLGQYLAPRLMEFVTYKSAASDLKFHLYFADPESQIDADEYPVQWSSKFCYDVKANGFVRSEPAYLPVNYPFDIGNEDFSFLEGMNEAILMDKQVHRAATRKVKAEKQGEFLPGSGDLTWEDWHEDGEPVENFTCDYEDALRIAGHLRNFYESYEDAAEEFCTATYESENYTGSETWAETFDRLWYSMEPFGGMSMEERQRREKEYFQGLLPDDSEETWLSFEAQKVQETEERIASLSEHVQAAQDFAVAQQQFVPVEDEETGYFEYQPAELPEYQVPSADDLFRQTQTYQTEFARQRARDLAKSDTENFKRVQREAEWLSGGKFVSPYAASDVPEPCMFTVLGSDTNPTSSLVVPNTVVMLAGERGGGKTWTAATWAAQHIRAGKHVVWLDFERQAQLMKSKAKALGIPEHQAGEFFHYSETGLPPAGAITSMIEGWDNPLIVVDSWQDLVANAVPDGDSNSSETIAAVYDLFLTPVIAAGATFCVIAHPAKNSNGGKVTVKGSERAESAADYVIMLEQKTPFARAQSGFAVITVTKDRYGITPHGSVVGALWVGGDDGKIGPGTEGYPEVPEIRCWTPASEAKQDSMAKSADLKTRQLESVVEILTERGGINGLVDLSFKELALILLERDRSLPDDQKSWVSTRGEPYSEKSVAETYLGKLFKGTGVPDGYGGLRPVRDSSGAMFLKSPADRHEETQDKPSTENFEAVE